MAQLFEESRHIPIVAAPSDEILPRITGDLTDRDSVHCSRGLRRIASNWRHHITHACYGRRPRARHNVFAQQGIQERTNSESHLEGVVGAGGPTVELTTSQGSIRLLKL
jgi:hypothetical protein